MNRIIIICLLLSFLPSYAQIVEKVTDPVEWVNPLIGTQSKHSLSNGNVYPAIALPWGMNFWTPQTGKMGDGWVYSYESDKINGFRQIHQPSPWIGDYGQFSIMPVTGKPLFGEEERASWFSHKAEIVKPYYYSVYLAEHDVVTEITPTERAAFFRFTFPENENSFVVIDALDMGSYIKIIPIERKIIGYTTKNSGGVPNNFKNYFVIEFDKPFTFHATFDNQTLSLNKLENRADHTGAVIGFSTTKGEMVNARVASSFISHEQAELNLKELDTDDFNQVKQKGKESWNKVLKTIEVEVQLIKLVLSTPVFIAPCYFRENCMRLMKRVMSFIIVHITEKCCLGVCSLILVSGILFEVSFLF